MNKLVIVWCGMAASVAWAQDSEVTQREDIDSVELRVSVFENIDVTAEKSPVKSTVEPDSEIDEILEEIETLEEDEAQE